MIKISYIICIISVLISCKDENIFPKLENVVKLNTTDFTPTLESAFDTKKNIIYGATMPLAWNEIKNQIGGKLSNFSSKQLEAINTTKSYIDVLRKGEYTTSVEIVKTDISAKAYFKKSLPFKKPLTKFNKPLVFDNLKVTSFGFYGSKAFAKLNYYNSENEFSVSLFPEDQGHEIILILDQAKNKKFNSFKDYFNKHNKEKSLEKHATSYFSIDDKVQIPIIAFNLEKSFNEIAGSSFERDNKLLNFIEAYQTNAFVLNENGAEVKSETTFSVAADAPDEIEKPKLMIFNKPFVVFLKRKDANHPYFGVYISNTELLKQ